MEKQKERKERKQKEAVTGKSRMREKRRDKEREAIGEERGFKERARSFSHKISRHFFSSRVVSSVADASSSPRSGTSEIKIGNARKERSVRITE